MKGKQRRRSAPSFFDIPERITVGLCKSVCVFSYFLCYGFTKF